MSVFFVVVVIGKVGVYSQYWIYAFLLVALVREDVVSNGLLVLLWNHNNNKKIH